MRRNRELAAGRMAAWRWALAALLALAAVLAAGAAVAGEPTRQQRKEALELAGEAMALFEAGDYQPALEKFEKVEEIISAPTVKLRIARCLDKLDRMHDAVTKYREVIAFELGPKAPKVHKTARKEAVAELAQVLNGIPLLELVVKGPGADRARLELDGEPLEETGLTDERRVDPGVHEAVARVGDSVVTKKFTLERGDQKLVELRFAEPKPDLDTDPIGPKPDPDTDDGEGVSVAGWVIFSLGAAGLVAGGVVGILVIDQESDLEERCPKRRCPPEAHEDAESFETLRTVSTVGIVAGGTLLATGLIMVAAAPSSEEEEPADDPLVPEVAVAPIISPTSAGIGLWGSF